MSAAIDVGALVVVDEADWRTRAQAHAERVDAWTAGRRERAARGEKHPVDDFLFTYYPTRPAQLRRWHPGAGLALLGATELAEDTAYQLVDTAAGPAATVDPARFAERRDSLAWVEGLVRRTAERPARLGCFGLHEWAMVYGLDQDAVRHETWPLRLTPQEVRAVVDELGVRCTHHDAFRFFTPAAAPLNEQQLTRATQPDVEQPGCLHAAMDLYKWASKFVELVGSDLVADAFGLAREARRLDMRAAPYDLRALGYEPVRIEEADGRADYVRQQRSLVERAAPLRARLGVALAHGLALVDARISSMTPTD